MRRILMLRCSLEKPSSLERCLRTTSPSSRLTGRPPSSNSFANTAFAIVDLPEPERPVKNNVKPCLDRAGKWPRSSAITSGNENHAGMSKPARRRRCNSASSKRRPSVSDAASLSGRNSAHANTKMSSAPGTRPIAALLPQERAASVVLAHDRVQQQFATAGVTARQGQQTQEAALLGEIGPGGAITAHAEIVISAYLHHRLRQQLRAEFARGACAQTLLRRMNGHRGMKGRDPGPSALGEFAPQLRRAVTQAREAVIARRLHALDTPAHVKGQCLAEQQPDARMSRIGRPEKPHGLDLAIGPPHLIDPQHREQHALEFAQFTAVGPYQFFHRFTAV